MTTKDNKKHSTPSKKEPQGADHLLAHEKVSFDEATAKPKATDEELNSRYARGDIRIVTESARYSLAGILAMLQETVEIEGSAGKTELRYKLDPEYQRRHRWSVERKSRLIESFLMNVPVPPVFLYERDLARFEVMDGRQRLTALSEFYEDKFALTGLQYWSDLDGRTYSHLPAKVRDGIDRRYISSIILLKETAANEEQAAMLKKMVFERLNSGGVKLGSQEARNAVYDGPLNKLCLDLSANETFRRMWGIPLDPAPEEHNDEDAEEPADESTNAGKRMFEKMEDVELVLRFFAYRQISSFRAGLNKISEFLDRFIIEGNRFPESLLNEFRRMFESTVVFLWQVLGAEAFWVLNSSKRPTKIVYDPMMFVSNSPDVVPHYEKLIAQRDVLRGELTAMYEQHQDLFSGRRTNYADTLREGPYQDGKVVVVDKPAQRLYVGQPVFVLIETAHVRWGRIRSLQVDDVSTPAVDSADSASAVGVAVDFKCHKDTDLFVLNSDDEVVWSPWSPGPGETSGNVTAIDG